MKELFALVALLGLSGCDTLQSDLFNTSPKSTALKPAPAPLDGAAAIPAASAGMSGEQVLLEADRKLGVAAQEKGLGVAIAEAADPEAMVLSSVGTFQGPDQIGKGLAATNKAGPLFWQPERAWMANSGDFGDTTGQYVQVLKNAEAAQGRYLIVWRKDATGRWRVLSNVIMPNPRLAEPPPPTPKKKKH